MAIKKTIKQIAKGAGKAMTATAKKMIKTGSRMGMTAMQKTKAMKMIKK